MGVFSFVPLAAEVDLAEVGAVAEDDHDAGAAPSFSVLGAVAACVELFGQGASADAVVHVHVEDHGDEWCFPLDGDELACRGVQFVSVGSVAAAPLAPGGFAFHAVDDAVDDGFTFELGEDAEHLHQHASDGGGGVERFGG
ncbi:hypothetical protein NGB36_14840 [Streptomyces sp. RB6PN25]|uniref:Uncharacterized protein n=1 Tax=Streptomyces humicola TaxID=2953240 RepID=A0ABT1PXW4_9ACTN|nr:hypothetical protein [Streptomyces humicola]MCQ4081850.1 hypothetical protein [Streptomyces humicola]